MRTIDDYTRYTGQGLLLDTNIALLLVVGNYDPRMLPNFKRTVQFAAEDYSTLVGFMSRFGTVVTTRPSSLKSIVLLLKSASQRKLRSCVHLLKR